ncbi:MAG: hypothetical protein COC00_009740 [Rhizobiales bacterium]|nr:hypothetical protein [Hyphomicrobiales bacterium]
MFESVLYFILGFLCSALIALMISPAIWNRAVVLTKRRIESSIPLSLNEIQADKDQLRAEFAMSTRRLEISVEELKDTAAHQVIDINRKRDELAKLSIDSSEKIQNVEELEARATELRSTLEKREDTLDRVSNELADAKTQLEEKALEFEKMNSKFSQVQLDADSSRIEMVAKQTALDGLTEKMSSGTNIEKELAQQLKIKETETKAATKKSDDAKKRIERLKTSNSELELKLQRHESDIADLRKNTLNEDKSDLISSKALTKEKAKTNRLEAKLATASLRMESLLEDASNENVKKAMASLNEDRASLKEKIKDITKERNALNKELSARRIANDSDWESERTENATLRERINDLAAQVTAMTASLEGPDSPINEILGNAPKKRIKKSGKVENVESLADRIRALQESARITGS